jgi:hypothetical protein
MADTHLRGESAPQSWPAGPEPPVGPFGPHLAGPQTSSLFDRDTGGGPGYPSR